ncbi:MAG: AtpZ/AtpI family protein [Bdellovibrionales bacterium]|nr:AtpZ/AtpI family protein [Bdellovibrionales bacterium]
MSTPEEDKKYKKKRQLTVFSGLGFEIIGLMLGSVFIGKGIDEALETDGLAIVILIILSFIVWLYHVIHMAKKVM